ncbi:nucleosome assembly protein-like protein [Trypanosoma cruzi cruzi]|uniref:Putative nucleosome assembly protein-like protein n=1 Tax=Trypanosoma cruzi TaxID=5693 RepID=A0A2V2UI79_TRYCR|nr:nucleosome assembly protein-like protein [Trypanosoma cruzi cruzi]PWU83681.1 putative nucleosome assembly protein-like protein [Trypanosoma cruzi]
MQKKQLPPKFFDPVSFGGGKGAKHDDEEEVEDDFDLVAVMKEMTVHERRKVYALKGILDEYKKARTKFREELAILQMDHLRAAQRLHDVRAAIVRGLRDVTEEEIAAVTTTVASGVQEIPSDDEEGEEGKSKPQPRGATAGTDEKTAKSVRVVTPQEEKSRLEVAAAAADGGIPDFWLTAMCNAEVVESMITERDRHALSFLQDIVMEYVEDDPQKGVRLNFHFAPNEYFTNTVLSKTYRMSFNEDSGEFEIDSMKSTPVEWKSPEKNLTVILKKKKQRHKKSKSIRVVTQEEKCPSFFTLFTDPCRDDDDEDDDHVDDNAKDGKHSGAAGKKGDKGDDEDDDDDDDEEEAEAELHIEVGQLLMEEIVPKAAFFYTGKSVDQTAQALHNQIQIQFGGDDDDDDDDEDEDDDEEDEDAPITQPRLIQHGRKGRGGAGGSGGRGGKGKQECKQQ